jgi:hypothetical protein
MLVLKEEIKGRIRKEKKENILTRKAESLELLKLTKFIN